MSNGSKEQELPEVTYDPMRSPIANQSVALIERERQLREALAQIATLTAQVAKWERTLEIAGCVRNQRVQGWRNERAEKAERERDKHVCNAVEMMRQRDVLKAELAALREGETVTYRVDWRVPSDGTYVPGSATVKDRNEAESYCSKRRDDRLIEVTTITRERILDADGGKG